jgi:hypothetical protein
MASILIFVKIVQGDYREWSEQRDADHTADEAFARNDFFHIPVCFVSLFVSFVPEQFVVGTEKEQVIGVRLVVHGEAGPVGIVVLEIVPLLLRLSLVSERGAFDPRELAMELGVEFMEAGLFEQIAAHLHHTVRPDTVDGVEDAFGDGGFGASFSRHGETIMAHSANRKSYAVRARCSQRAQGDGLLVSNNGNDAALQRWGYGCILARLLPP